MVVRSMMSVRIGFEEKIGAPGEIRTPDQLVRSQLLYPAELRAHNSYYMCISTRESLIVLHKPYEECD